MGERAIKEAAEHDREFSEATKIFLIFCSDRKLRSVVFLLNSFQTHRILYFEKIFDRMKTGSLSATQRPCLNILQARLFNFEIYISQPSLRF